MTVKRDPAQVRCEPAVLIVTTDCCKRSMALPRESVDLAAPRWLLLCFWCGRRRQLRLITGAGAGMRAVWSDPPGTPRWQWGRLHHRRWSAERVAVWRHPGPKQRARRLR